MKLKEYKNLNLQFYNLLLEKQNKSINIIIK
jgi:hypothetical protein